MNENLAIRVKEIPDIWHEGAYSPDQMMCYKQVHKQ